MIVYEDALQNLIIQLFLWFLFLFFFNSIVTIGEEKWGLEPWILWTYQDVSTS